MDWTPVLNAIIAALVTTISAAAVWLKVIVPRIVESRLKEREADILERAESNAYERNRKATHEDRTFEMLHDTLEFIQDRITKDDEYRERQLDQFTKLVEGLQELGFKYHNLAGNQTLTNQYLAVVSDELKDIKLVMNGQKRRSRPND
jgi:CRISPR/Cas system CSM-associated protein Csm2 small subunit